MNKTALRALLKERRELIAPEAHGLSRPTGRGRRARGLSQQQVDELTCRAIDTYNRLETGRYPNPPADYLRQVARLFGLNEQEWVSLCRYAGIGDPPGPLHPSSGLEVPGVWQEAVDGIRHMAYVTDASWNLLAHNRHFADMYPGGVAPSNTMRWMLLDKSARDAVLVDWRAGWAPLILPQLHAALAARRDDETLRQIEREVRADPDLGPLWEAGGAHIHPDGDERPIRHALLGAGHVSICAAQPLTAPGARLIIMIFRPGPRKSHARTPMLRVLT
ncbi:helix-turn-helix domain-containing protein [Streptomyces sp. NPDC046203]|uniref:MmyB family transcriptional regulator n=1 Tax=Streptomyces sp. NPDC046203 TaxID=3154602 RepID=UPI0033FDE87E